MRQLALPLAAVLAGCTPAAEEAAIVLYDPAYRAEILLDNSHAITSPDGLWWHAGALYIADEGGSAIRRWDGKAVETLADRASGIISPEDLVVDAGGRVWFTDDSAGGVWQVTPQGARQVAGSQGLAESEGIALLADGTIWAGDGRSGQVAAFPPDGAAPQPVAGNWQVAKPESMARTPAGIVWLADNRADRLLRIAPDGSAREWPLPADLSPESIAAHGEDLWITDSRTGRLYHLAPDAQPRLVALFLADFANIQGIVVLPDGAVLVAIQSDLAAGKGAIVRLVPVTPRSAAP